MKLIDVVKSYIMKNKKNSLLIIVSIIISTALFLVMNIISEDARNIMINQAKQELGLKNVSYWNPTNKQVKDIENNSRVDKIGKSMLLGLHEIGHAQTLQILWDDKVAQEINKCYELKEGKFPTKENEIAVDSWYGDQKKMKNPIGQTIKLNYSRPKVNGDTLYTGKKDFKIVGILKSDSLLKEQGMSIGAISEECAIKNIPVKDKYDQVMLTFKKEKNIPKQVEKLVKEENLNKDYMNLNNKLIIAMSDSMSLKIPYIIINMVLAFTTILLIYNIFYILVSNRTKDFGILRAVGFIPKDVSKIMILEIFIYSIISIPIGLLLGEVISNLFRDYVIGVIYNIDYANSIKSPNYMSTYIISALLSISTVIISVYKPLRLCSKIDPMICIRRNDEKIKINQKSIISKFMNKFYKDYGNIASKNIQRNKKRTNVAITSMVIIFFLMFTVYTKSTSNFLNDGGLRWWIPGEYLLHNIDINTVTKNEKSYDETTLKYIQNIDGVKEVNAYRDKHFIIQTDDKHMNKTSEYWKTNKHIEQNSEVKNGEKIYNNSTEFLGIEDIKILDDVLIDGKENLNKLNKEPYIYIDKIASEGLNLKKGDKVNINFNITDSKTGDYKETKSKEFIIGGIIKNLPLTAQAGTSISGVMSVNQMNKFTGISTYERFDIWTNKLSNQKNIESELKQIIENSGKGILIPYKSEAAGIEKSDNQKAMIMTLVVGVIVLLSLFNCCNTIVTSINSRSREFALFRGIGISKDEVKKIVVLESCIYIVLGFIISIIPTLIVRYIIIKSFETIQLINLKFIIAVILILLVISAIIIITTLKTLKNVQGEDFIEQIKTLE
ncbi:ABC transporter permease [Paraclostridium bifermentans]|uniref:ABC transporter permease n=2 Tax=Paraclostridium bifermentans TaxID=1490 RepID=UPI0021C2FB65|nr:ABC transporter permease [Paraclostridium bifermentans]GKZ04441.1 ABC transporter permease [Paraclostridium bifermentans]GKZ05801.1 ABC transporter permease [Paraclostridium bifermentans]GKZ11411.1 ABC transporter permease [Paraclostridium bifermentans]